MILFPQINKYMTIIIHANEKYILISRTTILDDAFD